MAYHKVWKREVKTADGSTIITTTSVAIASNDQNSSVSQVITVKTSSASSSAPDQQLNGKNTVGRSMSCPLR